MTKATLKVLQANIQHVIDALSVLGRVFVKENLSIALIQEP
jgi:hypothetical protein